MSWQIRFEQVADKQLQALDKPVQRRIATAIIKLALDPHQASNVKQLAGGGYRLRVGNYRVIYDLWQSELIVVVIRAAHRREVYR